MRLTLKAALPRYSSRLPAAMPIPCWQAQSKEPPDGRVCVLFDDRSAVGEDTIIYYGRTALDYSTLDKEQFGHFCAYEVNRNIARATKYYWLKGSEEEIRAKLNRIPFYVNKHDSVDLSKKWVFNSKGLRSTI